MINIFVWPEIAMKESTVDFKDQLVISITSPGSEHVSIKGTNVHKFFFHDVIEEYFLENQNRIVRPMEKEIAESIAEIAMNNRDCDRWIIHCEAGISRSPGVAIGIASVLKTDPDIKELKRLFPCFNTHVAKLVEEAIKIKVIELCKTTLEGE